MSVDQLKYIAESHGNQRTIMAIIRILQYPDPRLRQKGEWVDVVDDAIRKIVDDMFETHYNTENCAALAATQLDFERPRRITVIDFSPEKNTPLCLINPQIVAREGEAIEAEGCMSVQGAYENVKRAARITVQALDREGSAIEFIAEGFMAKCIQHELDHLEGKLFIDHLPKLKRYKIDEKIKKIIKQKK